MSIPDMTDTTDKDEVTAVDVALVDGHHPVYLQWITDEELAANPGSSNSRTYACRSGSVASAPVCTRELSD